jgi:hypothetical protein
LINNTPFLYCRKFQISEKIENGTITEMDFKKHRVYAAALQYEEENSWLKKSKQDVLFHPQDEKLQRFATKLVLFFCTILFYVPLAWPLVCICKVTSWDLS